MASSTDRIEKKVLLRAPRERVWRAISDSKQFGNWFGVEFDGPFVAGAHLTGRITPTKVDAEVAKSQEPYAGAPFECTIETVEPNGCSRSGGIRSPSSQESITRTKIRRSSRSS
jgi:uncharacterized protein YndB with AHSA1/START domain